MENKNISLERCPKCGTKLKKRRKISFNNNTIGYELFCPKCVFKKGVEFKNET